MKPIIPKTFLFRFVVLSVCGLAVEACQPGETESDPLVDGCKDYATRLGLAWNGEPKVSETELGSRVTLGDLYCSFDANAELRLISSGAAALEQNSGDFQLVSEEDAQHVAEEVLRDASIQSAPFSMVSPRGPWKASTTVVSVLFEQDAFGYPTNGLASRYELEINRYTKHLVTFAKTASRTPIEPHIVVTEGGAKDRAEPVWRRYSGYFQGATVDAKLQYFAALGSGATITGRQIEARKELRMCWIVTYRRGAPPGEGEPSSGRPAAIVAVDAETGDVLLGPD